MNRRLNRIVRTAVLAGLVSAAGAFAEEPSITILGTGFTGKPFVLGGDIVLETDSLVDLVRDYSASPVPALVGWYDHSVDAYWKQLVVDGGLCVALFDPNGTSVTGFSVVDATDPQAIDVLGSLHGMEFDSAWLRDGAATLSSGPLLVTYDLAAPATPVFSAATVAGDNDGARWFSSIGATLYLVDHAAALRALAVADPRHPAPLSLVTMPGDRIDAMVAGDGVLYALVAAGDEVDLVTWDAAVAGAPVEVDRQHLFSAAGGHGTYLARNGDLLVASGSDGVVRAFGLASPSAPAAGWTLLHAGDHLAISTSRVFVMDGGDLFVYGRTAHDVPPGAPSHRAMLPRLNLVEGRGSHLIAQLDERALRLVPVDVTDPTCPRLGTPLDLSVHGRLAYCEGLGVMLEGTNTCRLMDFSDPEHPALLGAVAIPDSVEWFQYELPTPGFLQINSTGFLDGTHLFDISDPWNPGREIIIPEDRVRYVDQQFAIGGEAVTLRMYDLTAPSGPEVVGTLNIVDKASGDVLVWRDHAYVTTYTDAGARDLRVFDISDRSSPTLDTVIALERSASRKDLHGNRIYMQHSRGFDVWDLTALALPTLIGRFAMPPSYDSGFAIDGNRTIVGTRLVTVLNNGLSASAIPTPGPQVIVVHMEPAFPNPCNPATTIAFSVDRERDLSVTVHDVRGRRVAELASGRFSAGPHEVTWRGLDDGGAPVASGVYLVRLHGAGVEAVQPVTLLK